MANNLIQIKRSNTSASPIASGNLYSGELGYSYNSNSLFIGAQTGITAAGFKGGGAKYIYLDQAGAPGDQTANAAVILDGNAFSTNTFTTGLAIQASSGSIAVPISSISLTANTTVLGANASGGGMTTELVTSGAIVTYVAGQIAGTAGTPGGANTQVQFNDSGAFGATSGMVFNKVSNNFTVSNTITTSILAATNITVSGNLTVSGTVTTLNTQTLTVNDNIIELGYNNNTADAIDVGWFSPAGNSTATWYTGFGRIAASSTNTTPYMQIFGTKVNPNTATNFDISAANSSTGYLQSYLVPYGVGGAFVANSSVINITANSTVSSALVANTLTLTTALGVASGGTGLGSYTAGDLIYASGSTTLAKLGVAANGSVLMITNNLPAFGTLDGGAF